MVLMAGDDFHAEIVSRLRASGVTRSRMGLALAILQQIRWYSIGPNLDVCRKTGTEIADELGITKKDLPIVLALLENVGAITRVTDGREKIICLSPEYAEAERRLNRFRQITLLLFTPHSSYQFRVGLTNLNGFWKQFRNDLTNLLASQK
jgi:DNA-binding MarR family transcriptional regulator